jgi:flagellar biosynthetic protein FlhB
VELSHGMTLGVGVIVMSSLLPAAGAAIAATLRTAIHEAADGRAAPSHLVQALGGGVGQAVSIVLPLGVAIAIAGVAGNLVAGGLVLSVQGLKLDFTRMNPVRGLANIANRQALVRLVIATAKFGILAFVTWQVIATRVPNMILLSHAGIGEIGGSVLDALFQLGLTLTILLAVVAVADFTIQRRRAQGQIRMTKEEVKQESREQEGDPLIRAARRRRARQMAFARMMDAVPTADVVVTNPTTYAVALKYDSLTMRAPHIVAKGQRLMAERIKELARRHGVPVVEDKPLARALFPRPLGSEVPPHLYRAVAQLLVIVQQARFGLRVRRPAGSPA